MLPKISHPIHNIKVPSLAKKYRFRPFLVKEEKILLMAKESNDAADMLSAIKQVVNNCCLDDLLDIDTLALFDVEYLFLQLRAVSVENISKMAFKDFEDEKIYSFDVDLNTIEVKFPEKADKNIKVSDTIGIVLKYPPATLYDDREFLHAKTDHMFELILRCVDSIYEKDEVYSPTDYTREELETWIDGLGSKIYEKIKAFILNTPTLYHVINYTNSLGHQRIIELTTLRDFFSWA